MYVFTGLQVMAEESIGSLLLELELQAVGSYPMWVLETRRGSSAGAAGRLCH